MLKGTTIADFNVTSKSAAATFTANTAIEGSVLKLTFKVKDGVALLVHLWYNFNSRRATDEVVLLLPTANNATY